MALPAEEADDFLAGKGLARRAVAAIAVRRQPQMQPNPTGRRSYKRDPNSKDLPLTSVDAIRSDFAVLDDWEDRYRYVLELGRTLEPLSEAAPSASPTDRLLAAGTTTPSTHPQPFQFRFFAAMDAEALSPRPETTAERAAEATSPLTTAPLATSCLAPPPGSFRRVSGREPLAQIRDMLEAARLDVAGATR
jgi:hypothetical protein